MSMRDPSPGVFFSARSWASIACSCVCQPRGAGKKEGRDPSASFDLGAKKGAKRWGDRKTRKEKKEKKNKPYARSSSNS